MSNRALAAVAVLILLGLAWAIVEVRSIKAAVQDGEPRFAGQEITRGNVTTGRYLNEPTRLWIERHREAERALEE